MDAIITTNFEGMSISFSRASVYSHTISLYEYHSYCCHATPLSLYASLLTFSMQIMNSLGRVS